MEGQFDFGFALHDQMGATLKKVVVDIPDEQTARERVYRFFKERARCPNCGTSIKDRSPEKLATCHKCDHAWRITKGTLFQSCKRFRPLLAAIYFCEAGLNIPATRLAKMFSTSYSTAWTCMRKAQLAQHVLNGLTTSTETDDSNECHLVEVSSSHFDELIAKRSILTPSNEHPRVQEEATDHYAGSNENVLDLEDLSEEQKNVFVAIGPKPVSIGALAMKIEQPVSELFGILSVLQVMDWVEALPGGMVRRSKSAAKRSNSDEGSINKSFLSAILMHIFCTSQTVSRKYLQSYLAVVRGRFGTFGKKDSLLAYSQNSGAIRCRDIRGYISPWMVTLKTAA